MQRRILILRTSLTHHVGSVQSLVVRCVLFAGAALPLLAAACTRNEVAASSEPAPPATVIDSILPMDTMIARFQAAMPRAPQRFLHGASSRAELIDRFAQALRDSSLTALRALRIDAPEFAYLYFPHSPLAAEPYRQPPQLAWLLLEQNGLKGEARLLRRFGTADIDVIDHACPPPVVSGDTRVWDRCTVQLRGKAGWLHLFGSIVEHGGRFKFVSFANDL